MASSQLIMDLEAGQAAKDAALDRFELSAVEWLFQARLVAARHCRLRGGTVTSDDVLAVLGLPQGSHNVVGAIFRKGFTRVGFRPTQRPEGHARLIGVWRVKG